MADDGGQRLKFGAFAGESAGMTCSRTLAIDFETANERRDSPCAVGLAWIEGGRMAAGDAGHAVCTVTSIIGNRACRAGGTMPCFGCAVARIIAGARGLTADDILQLGHLFAQFTQFCLQVGRRHGRLLFLFRDLAQET